MVKSILHLSDTHGYHNQLNDLPNTDLIIHSGDISFAGTENEIMDFMEWFFNLPHKYKIFIAGNHDDGLFGANIEGLPENCFYLCNSGITIENIKLYGIPMFMEDVLSGKYTKQIASIPSHIDVLVSHQPPYCILDSSANINYGSSDLLQAILRIQPKYHLFGHIHNAVGIEYTEKTTFVNAAQLDEKYKLNYVPFLLKIER